HDPGTARLLERLDHDLVDVDVQRTGEGEEDAVRHLFRRDRVDTVVDRVRLLLVAGEADEGELRLDQAGIDGRDADRTTEEVLAERVAEPAHGELRGDGRRPVRVSPPARDGQTAARCRTPGAGTPAGPRRSP